VAPRHHKADGGACRQPRLKRKLSRVTIACNDQARLAKLTAWLNLTAGMVGLRTQSLRRFGASLAGLALYLQLAFASWGMLATPSEPADAFGGHALCLAGVSGTTQPAAPSDNAPAAPAHDHAALCCLWHPLPGVASQTALTALPVTYTSIAHSERGGAAFIPGPQHGPANARAPPTLA
jgi:hypothetical protein